MSFNGNGGMQALHPKAYTIFAQMATGEGDVTLDEAFTEEILTISRTLA